MEIIEVSRTLEETSAKIEDMFLSLADKFSAKEINEKRYERIIDREMKY